jgi:hypothetical protein
MSDIYRYISMVINIGRFWAYRCIAITLPSFQTHKNSVAIALMAGQRQQRIEQFIWSRTFIIVHFLGKHTGVPLGLILVLGLLIARIVTLLGVLPLDAAGPAAAEGRLEAEVDVLLAVQADDEAGHVDHLRGIVRRRNKKQSTELQVTKSRRQRIFVQDIGFSSTNQHVFVQDSDCMALSGRVRF